MKYHERVSTGMTGFDKCVDMLRMGDNVVWQIDKMEDYIRVVEPYVAQAKKDGRKLVYMRFGLHPPVLKDTTGIPLCVCFSSGSAVSLPPRITLLKLKFAMNNASLIQ